MTLLKPSPGRLSSLFQIIEDMHGDIPWGSVLDAGTGVNSMRWITGLETDRWTAVSGAERHAIQVRDTVEAARRSQDRIVVGNWVDPQLLHGEKYDTVLADYLLGAIEGFAPYFQPWLFTRLKPLVRRRLYVVGLEPYVTGHPDTEDGRIVQSIGRYRDACLLLVGEQPYREYPAQWAVDHLEASGFRVLTAERYPIRYKQRFVNSQIDMCAPRLAKMKDRALADALTAQGEAIRRYANDHIARHGSLNHGSDYILMAEPVV